tara:strand:- start:2963 stop:3187 length:225 start_codon:yes stop_codon:yes gene_type:complete
MTSRTKPPRPKQWRYLVSEWLVERAINILSGVPDAAQSGTFQHLLERFEEARTCLIAEWKRDYPQDWPAAGERK